MRLCLRWGSTTLGKAKRRSLNLGVHNQIPNMDRSKAVKETADLLKKQNRQEAIELITLFGLSGEELLEAGCYWEDIMLIKGVLND